jgi:hypothetical protein
VIGTSEVTEDYFYFVQLNGGQIINNSLACAVTLGQFKRITTRNYSAGGFINFGGNTYPDPNCPPFDTTTVEWFPLYQSGACWSMATNDPTCGELTCSPFKFKKGLSSGTVYSSITIGTCREDGTPVQTFITEPTSNCPTVNPYAEVVL